MARDRQLLYVALALIVLFALWYYFYYKPSPTRESFMATAPPVQALASQGIREYDATDSFTHKSHDQTVLSARLPRGESIYNDPVRSRLRYANPQTGQVSTIDDHVGMVSVPGELPEAFRGLSKDQMDQLAYEMYGKPLEMVSTEDLLIEPSTSMLIYGSDPSDPTTYVHQRHIYAKLRKSRTSEDADPIRGDLYIPPSTLDYFRPARRITDLKNGALQSYYQVLDGEDLTIHKHENDIGAGVI